MAGFFLAMLSVVRGSSADEAPEEVERSCVEVAEERVRAAEGAAEPSRSTLTETPLPSALAGQITATLSLGRGLRFNNPYRLATPLGKNPESVSLTATYLDVSLGGALGRASGPRHGAVIHVSVALQGIAQQVITLGYVQLWRLSPHFVALGRVGLPIITRPDPSAGMEGALGAMWFATGGTGITAELVGSMFYGAATRERDPTAIPVVSLQAGVFLDHEVLP